jgi:hypothetical protein
VELEDGVVEEEMEDEVKDNKKKMGRAQKRNFLLPYH